MDTAYSLKENSFASVARTVKTEQVDTVEQYIDGEANIYQSIEDVINTETNCDTPKWKKFKCFSCNYSTPSKGNLKTHINRIHLKLRNHLCHLCDYKTSAKEILKNHINRVHLKLREHKCHLCDHSTHNKYLLKTHIDSVHWVKNLKFNDRIKSEYGSIEPKFKKFKCDSCNFSANTKGNLKTHFNRIHLKLREHKCCLCDYESSTKRILNNHISRVHLKWGGVEGHSFENSGEGYLQKNRVELIHTNCNEGASRFGEDEIQSENKEKHKKKW